MWKKNSYYTHTSQNVNLIEISLTKSRGYGFQQTTNPQPGHTPDVTFQGLQDRTPSIGILLLKTSFIVSGLVSDDMVFHGGNNTLDWHLNNDVLIYSDNEN